MPGINDVTENRAKNKSSGFSTSKLGFELRLKDGDLAVISPVPSGEADDPRLDNIFLHSIQKTSAKGPYWTSLVCVRKMGSETDACTVCAEGGKPQHKFAFWSFVHFILHPKQNQDVEASWIEKKNLKTGKVMFQEDINKFMVFSQGFGMQDYLWNSLVSIWSDQGSLNTKKMTIRRAGSGMKNTSYSLNSIAEGSELPTSDGERTLAELLPIIEYYKQRYSVGSTEPVPTVVLDGAETINLGDSSEEESPF